MSGILNEQEQVELIKQFWKKHGLTCIGALVVLIVALSGWQLWKKREASAIDAASTNYQHLIEVSQGGDSDKVQKIANELISNYPKTVYAGMSGLFLAEQEVASKEWALADQHLTFAKDRLKSPLQKIAILRLARVKMAENQPQAALSLLEKPEGQFAPLFFLVKGDAYLQLNDQANAKLAYQSGLSWLNDSTSLALTDDSSSNLQPLSLLKRSLQSKLNALSV
jgi:predicted negative regulator of RcsB-dependent stress response